MVYSEEERQLSRLGGPPRTKTSLEQALLCGNAKFVGFSWLLAKSESGCPQLDSISSRPIANYWKT